MTVQAVARPRPATGHRTLALVVFAQMLPATLLGPAVRPLFATLHGGDEGAMHAFLSLGMVGALIGAPLAGRLLDRHPERARTLLACLAGTDAFLLLGLCLPAPTGVVLALRTLEGGVHVAGSTLVLGASARLASETLDRRAVPLAGAALLAAVALGNLLGGALARVAVPLPFVVGAALSAGIALYATMGMSELSAPAPARPPEVLEPLPWAALRVPLGAAFVERFAVGCTVVSFSLLAHEVHHLDDRAVGGLYALMTTSFALTMYPAGRRVARGGANVSFAGGAALYGIALVVLALGRTAWLAPAMILAGVSSAPLYAAALGVVVDRAPAGARARAMAAFHAAGCAGMLVGPALAGITSALVRHHVDGPERHRAALLLGALGVWGWLGTFALRAWRSRGRA